MEYSAFDNDRILLSVIMHFVGGWIGEGAMGLKMDGQGGGVIMKFFCIMHHSYPVEHFYLTVKKIIIFTEFC